MRGISLASLLFCLQSQAAIQALYPEACKDLEDIHQQMESDPQKAFIVNTALGALAGGGVTLTALQIQKMRATANAAKKFYPEIAVNIGNATEEAIRTKYASLIRQTTAGIETKLPAAKEAVQKALKPFEKALLEKGIALSSIHSLEDLPEGFTLSENLKNLFGRVQELEASKLNMIRGANGIAELDNLEFMGNALHEDLPAVQEGKQVSKTSKAMRTYERLRELAGGEEILKAYVLFRARYLGSEAATKVRARVQKSVQSIFPEGVPSLGTLAKDTSGKLAKLTQAYAREITTEFIRSQPEVLQKILKSSGRVIARGAIDTAGVVGSRVGTWTSFKIAGVAVSTLLGAALTSLEGLNFLTSGTGLDTYFEHPLALMTEVKQLRCNWANNTSVGAVIAELKNILGNNPDSDLELVMVREDGFSPEATNQPLKDPKIPPQSAATNEQQASGRGTH